MSPVAMCHNQNVEAPFQRHGEWIALVSPRGHVMKLPHRRNFLRLAAGAATLPAASRAAWAQSYPSRPVHWIVGFAPGGGNDIVARLMGQWLSERLDQPVIIENRPGAATNIATETVVRAPPDGYTLLFVATSSAINATLYEKLNFNFIRDIAPVAGIIRIPNVMVVNPSIPARSVPEFIAYTSEMTRSARSGHRRTLSVQHSCLDDDFANNSFWTPIEMSFAL